MPGCKWTRIHLGYIWICDTGAVMALYDLFWLCDNKPYALTRCILALKPAYLQKRAPTYYQQIALLKCESVHFPFFLPFFFLERCRYRSSFKRKAKRVLDSSSLKIFSAWLFTFSSSSRSIVDFIFSVSEHASDLK